ncbi:calmodulin-binding receptor-like cytoplasmic kinase 2 isoform X1 [Ananas comosus]|uniref:non-specific serine/threonine protein kinase n=1 Tax=Ananas comosus TaxID=4615 RepID=A0A6P5GXF1_ANACO|nr:calmodulin-binding receptor-like cytoplasmic kinase 2 isoform X1 [Ananas comosus]
MPRRFSGDQKPHSAAEKRISGDRRPISAAARTPERWNAAASQAGGNPPECRRSPAISFLRSIGSCFTNPEPHSPPARSPPTPLGGAHGSSPGKRSGMGIYGGGCGDSPRCFGSSSFTMAEILKATKSFSPALKIGQGGFGTVYKGTLDDGTLVAIKRAKKSMYDSCVNGEFQSEIKIMARVEHQNLVRLYGYLEYGDERIIVVEYVPNGTLREHLDGFNGNYLDLAARLDIAIDVAHAVTYLHMYTDHPIIHRDIKASNILLTETLRAKVADFGFARLGAGETGETHVVTQIKGTAGYLDPEYLKTYQLTEKSDVFSFGVLLVELISGRRPIEPKREFKERITAKWAMKKFTEGDMIDTLDPNLPTNQATYLALENVFELAFECLAPTRQSRPSMRRCAEILWNIRKDYRDPLLSDPQLKTTAAGSGIVDQ